MAEAFPLFLYEYDSKGFHHGKQPIADDTELRVVFVTVVRKALDEKREVRITDSEDFLVFHAEDGKIVWPKPEDMAAVVPG